MPSSRSPRGSRSKGGSGGYDSRRDKDLHYSSRSSSSRRSERDRDSRYYRDRNRIRDSDRDRDRDGYYRRNDSYNSSDRSRSAYEDRRDSDRHASVRGRSRSRSPSRSSSRTARETEISKESSSSSAPPKSAEELAEEKRRKRLENIERWKKEKAAKLAAAGKNVASEETLNKASPAPSAVPFSGPKVPENTAPVQQVSTESQEPRTNGLHSEGVTLNGSLSTFGFKNKKAQPIEKRPALDFDDETMDSSSKPSLQLPTNIETDHISEEDDTEMADALEDQDEVKNYRQDGPEIQSIVDSFQNDGAANNAAEDKSNRPQDNDQEEEDEIDPLDAYMSSITSSVPEKNGVALPESDKIMSYENDDGLPEEGIQDDYEIGDVKALISSKLKPKKDIPIVNHSKIDYEPFRKSFYSEPAELAAMTDKEVDELRLELDGIKIRGVDCPKPCLKWSQFGLPAPTMEVIRRLGFEKPSSIQAQAVPAIMSGRDVIGVAKTGSGKTLAFLLPLFRQIKDQRPLEPQEGPLALVLTPTRELAVQIYRECKPFLKASNLRAVCAYGGAPIKDQIAEFKRGTEVVVCTPGRMIDLLSANSGRVTNLKRVTYLVLDEADRMFDMGFEPQVMKIIRNIRPDRQTVLFSATFPRQMEALARKILVKPLEIVAGARSVVAPEITQIVEVREERTKFVRVLELLGELQNTDSDARTLIFVDRQENADNLLKDLMSRGYPCMSIHGGKDQVDRDSTIQDFKAGVVQILIATSIAARGLDVKQLKLVINFDCPNHLEDYVHRVGRTGRAGNLGTAVTFITPDQQSGAFAIAKALKFSQQPVPESVAKLAESFRQMLAEGKEMIGSGFGGKGLEKLDEERDLNRRRERKAYAGDNAEDGEASEHDDEELDSILEKRMQGSRGSALAGVGSGEAEGSQDATTNSVLEQVKIASSGVESRFKSSRPTAGPAPDNHGPDSGEFHATIEINDFPQKARWAVVSKGNVGKIHEETGASITQKGQMYKPGETVPPNGQPKLYLLVEGETELSVDMAMRELKRLLVDATVSAAETEGRGHPGRYTVV